LTDNRGRTSREVYGWPIILRHHQRVQPQVPICPAQTSCTRPRRPDSRRTAARIDRRRPTIRVWPPEV